MQSSQFKAAWWLRNPHLQTIAAKFFRRNFQCATQQETLELPDGDFIDLAWTKKPQADNTLPIVVILHGLEGSKNSHYAKGILSAIDKNGWIGVLMHFRGCSGRPNRKARSYHSGDTRDISYFSTLLSSRFPASPLSIIGFSLGGNVLTRYLAEQPNNPYQAASAICAPLHLASCSQRINRGFSRIYQKYLLDMLRNSTKEKLTLKLLNHLDDKQLNNIKTIWEFDDHVTAPVNGFKNAQDYYHQASGRSVLSKINQPFLVIHASDDPFLEHQQIVANNKLPGNITFEVSKRGGHVGFISGKNPFKPIYWLEHRVPEFLKAFINQPVKN